ncbi:MAG: metallophosphoesterase [Sinimarinibacterium flocculans]|uniref:metallophosphoesterase n=1 Tax=Sinimarinibacterium flocculans TaxID=985250 RepID=UPI002E9AB67C|nr:metallophosphoesterase [Pseudomonadota bacterium]
MLYRDWVIDLYEQPKLKRPVRFLVIGDIHGQMDMLMRLARLTGYNPDSDHMVALGDLVDRGPASADVVRWFAGGALRTSLLGNHDALMVDSEFLSSAERVWHHNGGLWSTELDPLDRNLLRRLASGFPLAATLHLADGRRIGLVHAEVRPGASWADVQRVRYDYGDAVDDRCRAVRSNLLWGRKRYHVYEALWDPDLKSINATQREWMGNVLALVHGVDLVICGHTILYDREPVRFGSHLFIDTGAYEDPDGRLTAVDPVAGVYWQVGRHEDEQWGPCPLPAPFEDSLPASIWSGGKRP